MTSPVDSDIVTVPTGIVQKKREKNIFASLRVQVYIAWAVAVLAVVFSWIHTQKMAQALSQRPLEFVLDGNGNVTVGRGEAITTESEIFQLIGETATEIIFERGPKGLLKEHRIDELFGPEAKKALEDDLKAQMPELVQRDLHQHPEIRDVKYQHTKGQMLVFFVRGQLIRQGTYKGLETPEPPVSFTLALGLTKNPDIRESRQWPYKVVAFKKELETPK